MQSDRADRDARIRDRAYHIWVEEGRAHGKEHDHWHRAEREIAEADAKSEEATPTPTSGGSAVADRVRRAPARSAPPSEAGPTPSEAAPAPARRSRSKTTAKERAPEEVVSETTDGD